jgi:hypothetical protein
MSHLLDATAKGVYAISATPFTDAGEIDWASTDSLIEFYLASPCARRSCDGAVPFAQPRCAPRVQSWTPTMSRSWRRCWLACKRVWRSAAMPADWPWPRS